MKLTGIAIANERFIPLSEVSECEISASDGVIGDRKGTDPTRQVTVLRSEDWNAVCSELEVKLPWWTRRANLLITGAPAFDHTHVGKQIQIGDVCLEIYMETDPCARMDREHRGLRDALRPSWRGGVCCKVVAGGKLARDQAVSYV